MKETLLTNGSKQLTKCKPGSSAVIPGTKYDLFSFRPLFRVFRQLIATGGKADFGYSLD
jgi:hypothetical protein